MQAASVLPPTRPAFTPQVRFYANLTLPHPPASILTLVRCSPRPAIDRLAPRSFASPAFTPRLPSTFSPPPLRSSAPPLPTHPADPRSFLTFAFVAPTASLSRLSTVLTSHLPVFTRRLVLFPSHLNPSLFELYDAQPPCGNVVYQRKNSGVFFEGNLKITAIPLTRADAAHSHRTPHPAGATRVRAATHIPPLYPYPPPSPSRHPCPRTTLCIRVATAAPAPVPPRLCRRPSHSQHTLAGLRTHPAACIRAPRNSRTPPSCAHRPPYQCTRPPSRTCIQCCTCACFRAPRHIPTAAPVHHTRACNRPRSRTPASPPTPRRAYVPTAAPQPHGLPRPTPLPISTSARPYQYPAPQRNPRSHALPFGRTYSAPDLSHASRYVYIPATIPVPDP
ncbi:hypothetical protein R3P38DRAFT_3214491 [Favolaschia claudopus]|uniref:Uncharacterized protein n=1 Tax=Favolaschia claudopus TaxID=2862362 RepID=A0AAW0AD44_9AGAR